MMMRHLSLRSKIQLVFQALRGEPCCVQCVYSSEQPSSFVDVHLL